MTTDPNNLTTIASLAVAAANKTDKERDEMSHFNPYGNSKTVQQRQMAAPLPDLKVEEPATSLEDWEAKRIQLAANTSIALGSANPDGVYWTARLDLASLTLLEQMGQDAFDKWGDEAIQEGATMQDAALLCEVKMRANFADVSEATLPTMERAAFRQEMQAGLEGGAA